MFGYAPSKMTSEEFHNTISGTLTCGIDQRCNNLFRHNLSSVCSFGFMYESLVSCHKQTLVENISCSSVANSDLKLVSPVFSSLNLTLNKIRGKLILSKEVGLLACGMKQMHTQL
jgi:hypothetical protein